MLAVGGSGAVYVIAGVDYAVDDGQTGGICPITQCAQSLVNGPCGGQKNGKCEVNPENDCAWIKIYNRLEQIGQLEKFGQTREDKGYAKVSYPRTISLKGKK